MSAAHAVAVAVVFGWLGMVAAISFIEAPLKFRAPGVSLQIGLGIGRLVFRALNTVEAILAVTLLIAIAADPPSLGVVVAVGVVVVTLAAQLLVVRPWLSRRSDVVLAGPAVSAGSDGSSRRSRAHYGYVGLELVKVVALVVGGSAVLAA
jgi:hypothetical protein